MWHNAMAAATGWWQRGLHAHCSDQHRLVALPSLLPLLMLLVLGRGGDDDDDDDDGDNGVDGNDDGEAQEGDGVGDRQVIAPAARW